MNIDSDIQYVFETCPYHSNKFFTYLYDEYFKITKMAVTPFITRLKNWISGLSIYYKLLPFLLLYMVICIVFAPAEFAGDESRYIRMAANLSNGFYSPPPPDIELLSGPGYPMLITPFIFLKMQFISIRLLNAFLLYFSLIMVYKSCLHYSSKRSALLFTVLLGLYYPIYHTLPLMHTEALAWLLISMIIFLMLRMYKTKELRWKYLVLTAISLAYLAMTKVIFGYVIVVMILVSVLLFFLASTRPYARKSLIVFVFSFILCLPYLFYTYNKTGKVFYWATAGGMMLYTMSSPYPNEYGDWRNSKKLIKEPTHSAFMNSIADLSTLEKDEAFRKAAIENIKNHPTKYFTNWAANIGRLLFHYPFSYKEQTPKTYFIILPNMFVIAFIILSMIISIRYINRIPIEILLLLLLIMVYLFGSSLVSAYRRMFIITMPFWFLYFSYFFSKIVSVTIRKQQF